MVDGLICSVFIATSLDGFIARADGSLDWLPGSDAGGLPDEDHGYAAFLASVDVLVMGRATFETVLGFGGPWPYAKPVVVLSRRDVAIPDAVAGRVRAMRGAPEAIAAALAAEGFRHAYLDGGVTIQRFLAAGLVDRMTITRVPVLLGRGIPLFGPLAADVRLRHERTEAFASGLVQSRYAVIR